MADHATPDLPVVTGIGYVPVRTIRIDRQRWDMQKFAQNLGTIGYDALSIGQGMLVMLTDIIGMGGSGNAGAGQYPLG
ncbi:hypothetical protein ACQP1O_09075 [Nocardia sp. CA-151230]|uniref:hypothetical protein n=1 Tax=Nocardia sp. CA-151230 TaxID=3239982 RepID=UPI003D91AEB1